MNDVSHDRAQRKKPVLVAVDLGAESCRVSLLRWIDGEPEVRLVHRFANSAQNHGNGLRWNIASIAKGVEEGLRTCASLAPEGIAAIGVDGWAVDYVRLNQDGQPVADPFCYRDGRAAEAQKQVLSRISADRLYQLTGVQILYLNTLYQLHADGRPEQNLLWMNLPEFLLYRWGGRRVSEYTNATHTQLLSVQEQTWCPEVFEAAELDPKAAPPLVKPGTDLGRMQGELAGLPAFGDTRLIAPACHDTASAIAGIPALGADCAFISSGTWSLVGCVLDSACVSAAARRSNFSNEGGVGGNIYFLKNVNGMWLLRQCMEHWRLQGEVWTVEKLVEACASQGAPDYLIDVDEPDLLLPGDMPARINAQLNRIGGDPILQGQDMAVRMTNLILHSLAARYAAVLRDASSITGRTLKRLYVVGGGSRNVVLNRLTAKTTGLQVLTGATESATVGNFAIQLAALEGNYTDALGVRADAVAKWASLLAPLPMDAASSDTRGNSLPAHKVETVQPPTGKALA
ncbi:MAG: rhamnulokinase [Terriglobales bacterium]